MDSRRGISWANILANLWIEGAENKCKRRRSGSLGRFLGRGRFGCSSVAFANADVITRHKVGASVRCGRIPGIEVV